MLLTEEDALDRLALLPERRPLRPSRVRVGVLGRRVGVLGRRVGVLGRPVLTLNAGEFWRGVMGRERSFVLSSALTRACSDSTRFWNFAIRLFHTPHLCDSSLAASFVRWANDATLRDSSASLAPTTC